MGWDYYNDPATGKSYPSGSTPTEYGSYSAGDGRVVHKVGTGAEITGSSTPKKGSSGFCTDDNKIYIYDGSTWRSVS